MAFLDITTRLNCNMLNNQYNLFNNYASFNNIFSYPYNFNYNFNFCNNIFSYVPTYSYGYGNYTNLFNYANSYSLAPYISSLTIDTSCPYYGNIFAYSNPFYDYTKFKYIPTSQLFNTINPFYKDLASTTQISRSKTKEKNKYKTSKMNANINTKNISAWEKIGYNAQKGIELAKNALNNAVGFTGYCARYVKKAICKSNLGSYESGNASDMISIMRRNNNFKEINPNSVDVNNLPPGCVLVYNRGVAGYSSQYGHTEITDGSGRGISDGITNNLRKPTAIFMPVVA